MLLEHRQQHCTTLQEEGCHKRCTFLASIQLGWYKNSASLKKKKKLGIVTSTSNSLYSYKMSQLPKCVHTVEALSCRGCVAADRATEQFVKLFFLLKSLSDEMMISFLLICVGVGLLKEKSRLEK